MGDGDYTKTPEKVDKANAYQNDSNLVVEDYSAPPDDKWKAAYILLFFMGMASLIPWNMFITASSYFLTRLQSSKDLSEIWPNTLTVTVCVSNIIGSMLAIAFQHKIAQRKRILFPLIVNTLVFILCTAFVFVEMDVNTFFIVSLICANACGICGSFLQGGMFGLAGDLPPVYTQALMGGQGLAGFAVSINALIAAIQTNSNGTSTLEMLKFPTMAYFLVAVFILLVCVVGFMVLERLPFVHHYQNASQIRFSSQFGTPAKSSPAKYSVSSHLSTSDDLTVQLQQTVFDPLLPQTTPTLNWNDSKIVLGKIRVHALCVFLIFCVTLSVFPSKSETIVSVQRDSATASKFYSDHVFTTFSFVNFNFCDFLGRLLAGFISIKKFGSGTCLASMAFLRWGFVVLFLFCNTSEKGVFPTYFNNDVAPIVIMTCFALTNGLISSMSMMRAPALVAEHEMSTTGTMMSFFMMGGLLGGSILSFPVVKL